MRISCLLLVPLLAACGVSLGQIAEVGKSLTALVDRCGSERKAGADGVACAAAKRCVSPAAALIGSAAPTKDQLQLAQTLCKAVP